MSTIITLTDKEMEEALEWGKMRYIPKKNWKGKTFGKDKKSYDGLAIHEFGLQCEIAVAKHLGVDWDREINNGDKNRPDIWLENLGIQIKGRTKKGWDFALYSDKYEELKSDIQVLCWGGDKANEIEIVGYATREEFVKNATIKNYRYGPRLALEPQFFHPVNREILLALPQCSGLWPLHTLNHSEKEVKEIREYYHTALTRMNLGKQPDLRELIDFVCKANPSLASRIIYQEAIGKEESYQNASS